MKMFCSTEWCVELRGLAQNRGTGEWCAFSENQIIKAAQGNKRYCLTKM